MASFSKGVICANGSPPVTRTCAECGASFSTLCRTACHCPVHNTPAAKRVRRLAAEAKKKALNKPLQNQAPESS